MKGQTFIGRLLPFPHRFNAGCDISCCRQTRLTADIKLGSPVAADILCIT